MLKYILKRLLYIVFVFFIISILMFCIYKAVPGDPARLLIEGNKNNMDPVRYEMLYQEAREKLGLDQPLYVQYFSWMRNLLTGTLAIPSYIRCLLCRWRRHLCPTP